MNTPPSLYHWPFVLHDTKQMIWKDKWYAFGDATVFSFEQGTGFNTQLEAEGESLKYHKMNEISFSPTDLGEVPCVILTGQQFLSRLDRLNIIDDFGDWTPVTQYPYQPPK